MLRSIALVALLALGCAVEAPASPVAAPAGAAAPEAAAVVTAALESAPEPCRAVFSVPMGDEAFAAEVAVAAARWASATGCDVQVGAGGIPVELVEATDARLWDGEKFRSGMTYVIDAAARQIGIVVKIEHVGAVIPHEMGHALGLRAGHTDEAGCLMSADVGDRICASDLEYVCERLACSAFVSE